MSLRRAIVALVSACGLTWSLPALAGDRPDSIVGMVARVIPTVVSIETVRATHDGSGNAAQAAPNVEKAEGSGFIVDRSGYIATNRHVVEGACRIIVTLHDGQTVEAKVVWMSSIVDVAFLTIQAGRALPAATMAGDQNLKLGQRVIAIGNPVGLGISVTAGVVSGLDRNIKQSPYDDFIQTDAAINHGNSGGPLFDEAGEVVGMNSTLWANEADGGSQGLGFAIPGSDLTFLIDQLKAKRDISCGGLGAHVQKVTATIGDALGFPGPHGVIVASIDPDSPVLAAGLRRGDVIETFDGKALYDITTLNRLSCSALGRAIAIEVWRDGQVLKMTTALKEFTNPKTDQPSPAAPRFASAKDLGMTLAPVGMGMRRRYHLPDDVHGLAVTAVAASGAADVSGLVPGDIIISLQMTPLSTDKPFDETLADYARKGRQHVILMVRSEGGERWISLPVHL